MRSFTATAILLATMLTSGMAQNGGLVLTPTTTLSAETANNTSAADSFTAQTNNNPAPSNISKLPVRSLLYAGATTKIYAHFMPWFGGTNHMWVGYRSDDRAQVNKQVTDMMSRGYDGAIVDWYGPNNIRNDATTLYLRDEAETRGGLFTFAVMEDVGALNACAATAGCDVTQRLVDDLNYAASTYYGSPAYMRIGGRPVVFFFGVDKYVIDWARARAGVNGDPMFIFRNSGSFSHAQSDGGFSWVGFPSSTSDIGLAYLDDYYTVGARYPTKQTFGSAYPGFDNTLAAWVSNPPKMVNRFCGRTWMDSLNEAGKYYSAAKQLPQMQMVTWNDYEEGSQLETGIDSCAAVSAAVNGATLSWTLSGDPAVIDHYNVFVSTDGQNLMRLSSVPVTQAAIDLSSFALAAGSYTLYVQAYAKASMRNAMSSAASYSVTAANRPPVVTLALDRSTGVAPETVNATATASDPDGSIAATSIDFGDGSAPASAASAAHPYTAAGSYTVTATATDNLGVSASATATVTIAANQPPVATLALSPGSGTAPVSVAASTAGSTDADGSVASSSIDFGDGTVAAGPTASHTYATAGTKTVTATVTDNKGASSSTSGTVSVAAPNQPPVAALSVTPSSGTTPVTVTASTAGSNDPDGSIASSSIDFGDGTVASGTSVAHVYSTTGVKTITATVTDSSGATAQATAMVNVTAPAVNQAPVAALSVSPTSGMAALNVAVSAAGSRDPDGAIASTKIDFGDGAVATTPAATHVYSKVGTYTVRATVTDNKGASASTSKSLAVTAGVKITSPAAGASATSPVRITASAASAKPITQMRVYVDNVSKYVAPVSAVNTTLTLTKGTHSVVVQAWDAGGAVYKSSVTITVR